MEPIPVNVVQINESCEFVMEWMGHSVVADNDKMIKDKPDRLRELTEDLVPRFAEYVLDINNFVIF